MIPKNMYLVIAIVVAYYFLANYHYDKGHKEAVQEFQVRYSSKLAEATAKAIKSAEVEVTKAIKKNQALHDADVQRVKDERIVETKIIKVLKDVEKIVYVDNCGILNTDSVRLLNNSVNRVNGIAKD